MDIKQISEYSLSNIKLNKINADHGPYCMSFEFEIKPLIESIKKIGLTNPPYVAKNPEGIFEIVMGYRRVLAFRALKHNKMPCYDIGKSGLSEGELLLLNLYDNLTTRKFNIVEKGMIINRLSFYFPDNEIGNKYIRLLDISNPDDIEMLRAIPDLTDDIKTGLAKGLISLNTLKSTNDMDKQTREAIIIKISELKFNFNQQIIFIENIIDISQIENISIKEILNDYTLADLKVSKDVNIPQRAKKILDQLRRRRKPFVSDCEDTFRAMIKDLNLPQGVNIRHSPFFESPDYHLDITFKKGDELKKKIDSLARNERIMEIKDPWEES